MTKCERFSRDVEDASRFEATRAGVAMTISGESARRERWTASDTRWVRLMALTSFAQNAQNDSTTLWTCSASSRVGTSMRADMHGADEAWRG
jgi:hypothetical protein